MPQFIVHPSPPLSGTVKLSGAKNSILKLMAATLLAKGVHVIKNVPHISDVGIMSQVLVAMGAKVTHVQDVLRIEIPSNINPHAPYHLVEQMRASVVVLGPLLARYGQAEVSLPGGDDFGSRPIDMHLKGLEALGAVFETSHGYILGTASNMVGAEIVLEYPSHTATDNLIMAAVLSKGTTTIDNAAREPEVVDLANFLSKMGAIIKGAGTSTIQIQGVDELQPSEHVVIPDRVEAATFLASVGIAKGEIFIQDAQPSHMSMLLQKLKDMGMTISAGADGLFVKVDKRLKAVDVATLPFPGIATDYKPFIVTMLALSDGIGIVTENLFAGRFRYVDELRRMGADIRTEGHHAVVRGVERLSGAPVRSFDIRAGAALVLAGLAAEGETIVANAEHILRGYDSLDAKLASLGADVYFEKN